MRGKGPVILDKLILLAATSALAARQYGWPSYPFWTRQLDDRAYVIPALIVVIGIFGALSPFRTLAERGRGDRKEAIRRQILSRLGHIIHLSRRVQPSLELGDVGLHIWRVCRPVRQLFRPRLKRVATYRLSSAPATRRFDPPKGVGVVGLCWLRNEEVGVDVAALATALTSEPDYKAYRARHGLDALMGLSWQEFQRLKHRGAVFASPIRNGQGRFIGCVSVDASHGFPILNDRALWRELNSLCDLIGQDRLRNV